MFAVRSEFRTARQRGCANLRASSAASPGCLRGCGAVSTRTLWSTEHPARLPPRASLPASDHWSPLMFGAQARSAPMRRLLALACMPTNYGREAHTRLCCSTTSIPHSVPDGVCAGSRSPRAPDSDSAGGGYIECGRIRTAAGQPGSIGAKSGARVNGAAGAHGVCSPTSFSTQRGCISHRRSPSGGPSTRCRL